MELSVSTRITTEPLNLEAAHRLAQDDRCGAIATFTGVVRNHDGGRNVDAIDYSAHPNAEDVLRSIVTQFLGHPGVHKVVAHHRTGHLVVGDIALLVVVAAEHRAQAMSTAEGVVETIKARVPIWKKQLFSDGNHAWSGMP